MSCDSLFHGKGSTAPAKKKTGLGALKKPAIGAKKQAAAKEEVCVQIVF